MSKLSWSVQSMPLSWLDPISLKSSEIYIYCIFEFKTNFKCCSKRNVNFGQKSEVMGLNFVPTCNFAHILLHLQAVQAYACTGLNMFRSVYDRIHSGTDPPCLHGTSSNWNGTVPHRITFRSGPIWYQIADPIRTGSTRSRLNTRLIHTNFVLVPNGSGPV